MKLNESNLADPLLLTGCALNGSPWGSSLSGQDLITTTTFPDETLLLPPQGETSPMGKSSSSTHSGSTSNAELDALLIVHPASDSLAELKPLPPFEYAMGANVPQITLHSDPQLPQMSSESCSPHSSTNNNNSSSNNNNNNNGNSNNSSSSNNNGVTRSNNNNNNGPHHHGNSISMQQHNGRRVLTGGGVATPMSRVDQHLLSPPGSNPSTGSFGGSPNSGSPGSLFDPVSSSTSVPPNIKSELAEYLLNSDIDDIAALIGNAIADSTVPNLGLDLDPNVVTSSTIDPWTELDAWIESACQQQPSMKGAILDQDASSIHTSGESPFLSDANNNVNTTNGGGTGSQHNSNGTHNNNSTLQALLVATDPHHYNGSNGVALFQQEIKAEFTQQTSILQSRLQQQPNSGNMVRISSTGSSPSSQMPESTTPYGLKVDPYTLNPGSPYGEVQRPHTTHLSPPQVTSTMMNNGNENSNRYRKSGYQNRNGKNSGFHHSGPGENYLPSFNSAYDHTNGLSSSNGKLGMKKRKTSKMSSSTGSLTGLGSPIDNGKEKPIHRCGICNRGFLNKSNIKVHLRTHTGEKPFKCETCGKAFRQKAHLLKHVQIHKRIQRD